jgi:glycosyltransferase involved in cell wall biosynthesis
MRIAQVSPLFEAVPPKLYGGTERVVSNLTEELVALGHELTLFASGDSVTSAKLEAVWPQAIRLDPTTKDWNAAYARMLELVYRQADTFDAIHFHIDYFPFSLFSRHPTPHVTTLHGRLDLPEYAQIYNLFPHVPVVSISDAQRRPLPRIGWVGTVQHGLPRTLLTPRNVKQEYFAFLGRISPDKGLAKAIRIAGQCGARLKIAAKVDKADQEYFEHAIKPLLAEGHVEFIGEINDGQKAEFLSGAHALLFPIDWPEPFGLVMIEAMACGTPVIAFNRGSVPEVIEEGLTGFVVEDEAGAASAIRKLGTLSRERVRARFETRWTARRMAEDYLEVYGQLQAASAPKLRAVGD